MVARFYLDQSQLDDANVGLDGPSPAFVLDTSQLDGDGKLDGTTFTTTATAVAVLGALAASASATISKVATAVAPLGELIAEVAEVTVTIDAQADGELGGLTASAIGDIDNPGTADAPLGGLSASADGGVTIVALASAGLGDATSTATGTVSKVASAESLLGGVVAAATGTVIPIGTMTANLGGLDATAIGTVTPQPSPTQQVGGRPNPYQRQRLKKKVEPVVEVEEIVIVPVKEIQAYCTPIVASVNATAVGEIMFVAEDDDLQVLLML